MKRVSQFCALGATLMALSGCSTVTDLITSTLPESHSGRPSIVVSLREQEAYIRRTQGITEKTACPSTHAESLMAKA